VEYLVYKNGMNFLSNSKQQDTADNLTPVPMVKLAQGRGVAFLGTKAKAHWYFRENQRWWPYEDEDSGNLEQLFKGNDGKGKVQFKDFSIDFDTLTSVKQGASKPKHITRGVWFFKDDVDGSWQPYMSDIASHLEEFYQLLEQTRGNDADFNLEVSNKPPRFVKAVEGSNLTEFKQYRQTKNANPEGRPVLRGYNGTLYKKVMLT